MEKYLWHLAKLQFSVDEDMESFTDNEDLTLRSKLEAMEQAIELELNRIENNKSK